MKTKKIYTSPLIKYLNLTIYNYQFRSIKCNISVPIMTLLLINDKLLIKQLLKNIINT